MAFHEGVLGFSEGLVGVLGFFRGFTFIKISSGVRGARGYHGRFRGISVGLQDVSGNVRVFQRHVR